MEEEAAYMADYSDMDEALTQIDQDNEQPEQPAEEQPIQRMPGQGEVRNDVEGKREDVEGEKRPDSGIQKGTGDEHIQIEGSSGNAGSREQEITDRNNELLNRELEEINARLANFKSTEEWLVPVTEEAHTALVDQLKKTGLARDVRMLSQEEIDKELDKVAGAKTHRAEQLNEKFNDELEKFRNKTLKTRDLHLGIPEGILRASGLQASEITIDKAVLAIHLNKHGLKVDDIKDLAKAIQKPIMVYEWGTKAKSLIITEIRHGENKITVAVKLERNGEVLNVNELASVHGKSAERFFSDMLNAHEGGLEEALRWVEHEKALEWLGFTPPKGVSSLTNQELSIAKIIRDFDNPSIPDDFNTKTNPLTSDIRYQIIGETGATALDKAEESTHRLDNLAIAREMESGDKTPL